MSGGEGPEPRGRAGNGRGSDDEGGGIILLSDHTGNFFSGAVSVKGGGGTGSNGSSGAFHETTF